MTAPAHTAEDAATRPGTLALRLGDGWFTVCALSVLTPGRGVAALLPDGRQAAVFLDRAGHPYAIDNRDPYSGAQVLSRGLLGARDGRPYVASPLLKQRFDLTTGRCLDDESVSVRVYPSRIAGR
ncbi:nitrite reductase small subunit NirD [Streptomyces sp. AK02-01A]|uniref:nitrite reductase small subunit NirD n=1 Tax=Streptomyces sp. AK02-01A TaxID=3028648 RepID=UPI0029A145AE|nr:nitrite reductase small subunit NirD [Streptomyces sp. AK02-01A]MDX3849430.1 nitrite reductase small subunit NirD [Streptomyces sp. AK02-01A]